MGVHRLSAAPGHYRGAALVHETQDQEGAEDEPNQQHACSQQSRLPSLSSINRIHVHLLCLIGVLFLGMLFITISTSVPSVAIFQSTQDRWSSSFTPREQQRKYLYWGYRIDCPGKHCATCEGLGHQESSLRCALEEALVLNRTFVMPSRMCINQLHNDKGILHSSLNDGTVHSWGTDSCSMDSLYDLDLISQTVRVILDSSSEWQIAMSTARRLGAFVHITGINRSELHRNRFYQDAIVINRTASPLSWFMECKDRKNHSGVLLPYSFLPKMAAKPLQMAAQKIQRLLGDYDSLHVRRGDKLKIRKDRFGVNRTLLPHLDRDTQPLAIMQRIANWIPQGRTIFLASNERSPGFFDPLSSKFRVVQSSNFTSILDPVVQNNYQLFMVERLVLLGAKTFVKTFKEEPSELSLTDDKKKKIGVWEIPVYTFDKSPRPM